MIKELTQEHLNRLFIYDNENGVLYRRINRGPSKAGDFVGTVTDRGYLSVEIESRTYYVHRIIWFMIHGDWPKNQIDHINGNRCDNRLENLRDVSSGENCRNSKMPCNNKSGVTGVKFHKRTGKWKAQVFVEGKSKFLGYFSNIEDAENAVSNARRENGYTERHGQPAKEDG